MTEIKKQTMKMPTEGDQDHLEQHIQIHGILNTVQDYCIFLFKRICAVSKEIQDFSTGFQKLISDAMKAIAKNQRDIAIILKGMKDIKNNPLPIMKTFDTFVGMHEIIIIPDLFKILNKNYDYLIEMHVEGKESESRMRSKEKKPLSFVGSQKSKQIKGYFVFRPIIKM